MINTLYCLQSCTETEDYKYLSTICIFDIQNFKISYLETDSLQEVNDLYNKYINDPSVCFLNFSYSKVKDNTFLRTALPYKYKTNQITNRLQLNEFSIYNLLFDIINTSTPLYKDGRAYLPKLAVNPNRRDMYFNLNLFSDLTEEDTILINDKKSDYSFSFIPHESNKQLFSKYNLDVVNEDGVSIYKVNYNSVRLSTVYNNNINESICAVFYCLIVLLDSYEELLKSLSSPVSNDEKFYKEKLCHFNVTEKNYDKLLSDYLQEFKQELKTSSTDKPDFFYKAIMTREELKLEYSKLSLILHSLNASISGVNSGVFNNEEVYSVGLGKLKYTEV